MKTYSKILKLFVVIVMAALLSSCVQSSSLPRAFSSMSKVHYIDKDDLGLSKGDFQILNTEFAEASVYSIDLWGKKNEVSEAAGEFSIVFEPQKSPQYSGIIKYGTLDNDFSDFSLEPYNLAKGLATYRLINSVQEQGADAIIEPIVTVKIGQEGRKTIYTATISAKLIKINTK